MRRLNKRKEDGFVLVWALLLMVVVLILGVSGIGTSIFQALMSSNDALHKQAFYQADGGTNAAAMLVEENVSCPGGFKPTSGTTAIINAGLDKPSGVVVQSLSLYMNDGTLSTTAAGHTGVPTVLTSTTVLRDAYYFYDATDPNGVTHPRTDIRSGGEAVILSGSATEMGAGYEGRGKGLAGGGSGLNYDTFAQYTGVRESQNTVEIVWQHVIGFEGTCNY